MLKMISYAWKFIFDVNVSPLRHIPNVATRHMVLQALGAMWAVAFATAIGSYYYLPASLIGHAVLIGAVSITSIIYGLAAKKPEIFRNGLGRSKDGEHQ